MAEPKIESGVPGNGSLKFSPALDRIAPQALESEQMILGAMMEDGTPETFEVVAALIEPGDFLRKQHREIYAAITRLVKGGESCHVLAVDEELERVGLSDYCGGRAYLVSCQLHMPLSLAAQHARTVRDRSLRRRTADVCGEYCGRAFDTGENIESLLDEAEAKLALIRQRTHARRGISLSAALDTLTERLEEIAANNQVMAGIPSLIPELDKMTGGFRDGSLVILAGRTAMGKTSCGIRFCVNVASQGLPVVFFSLEMETEDIVTRMIAPRARINTNRIDRGMVGPVPGIQDEWADYQVARAELNPLPILLDTAPGATLAEIRSRSRQAVRELGARMVIVDYLHLIGPPGRASDEVQRLGGLAVGLKNMARELNLPVIVLSQINREPEKGRSGDSRPRLSDLKGSGAIEESADLALLLYRPEYYNREPNQVTEVAELIVAKNRRGRSGVVRLKFTPAFCDFVPLETGDTTNGE